MEDRQSLKRVLREYATPSWWESGKELSITCLLYASFWCLSYRSAEGWSLAGALFILAAACLLVRLFLIMHDCAHGAFFPGRRVNALVGSLIGVLALTPFGYWRRTHAYHHAHNGNLDHRETGDISILTVAEYFALSPSRRLAYRLYRHPLCLFVVGAAAQFFVFYRVVCLIDKKWMRERNSVLLTNAGILGLLAIACVLLDPGRVLFVQSLIWVIGGSIGVWFFYVQHNFVDTYWTPQDEWDFYDAAIKGSSFYSMPRLLHCLFANIGYHHIHHLDSRIPSYRLRRCFEDDRVPAPRTTIRLGESVRTVGLKLWDELSKRMVSFEEARKMAKRSQSR